MNATETGLEHLAYGLNLKDIDVGPFSAKPTTLTPGQEEASVSIFESDALEVGVWECTPGSFTADRTNSSETCYFLSGRIEFENQDGSIQSLGAGDSVVLPRGWKGTWKILETTRKLYVISR